MEEESASPPPSSCDQPAVSIPAEWRQAAESVAGDSATDPPPVAVICGPGNSGKSTFSRLLLDALLQRYKKVGYLDTDVGQPEFTTPGCLSLHIIDKAPPDLTILCLRTPERCFFYGDVNCQKDKNVYLKNILSLYDYFREEYYQSGEKDENLKRVMLPLVVNTSGWIQGAGYGLLVEMLRYISPPHVVQIRVAAENKNLPKGVFWSEEEKQAGSTNLIEICAAERDTSKVSGKKDARLLRDIRIVAYFRQCLPIKLHIPSCKDLVESLASVPAYKIPLSKLKVIQLHCQDASGKDPYSLKGNIIGLGISSFFPSSQENSMPWCVGLGFVPVMDVPKNLLNVITPIPLGTLEKVDVVLQGYIEVPELLSQVQSKKELLYCRGGGKMDVELAITKKQFPPLLST